MPLPLLAKVLQKLAKEGFLAAAHGTNGGYRLARDAGRISALEVIRAIDGPVFLTSCSTLRDRAVPDPELHRARAAREDPRGHPSAAGRHHDLGDVVGQAAASAAGDPDRPRGPSYEDADLHGQPRHHAGRPARARGDAAVLHRAVRQRRQPQPQLRLGGRGGGREGPRADRRPDRRHPPRRSSSPAAPPSPTTWPSRAWPRCTPRRATTSSPRPPSTRPCSTPASSSRSTAARSPSCRWASDGLVDLDALRAAITDKTILISIMHANNEIGVLQPIREIGRIANERGVLFHTDATQAVGKVPVERDRGQHRPAVDQRAQDVRPQGRRRALRAAQEPARAADRADGRRRPRARHALRHAERAGHRRPGRGLRDLPQEMAGGIGAAGARCATG